MRGTRTLHYSGGLGPGAFPSLSRSLCLCLHQINGPGPDRGSVSISTACQACPSPRQPLIHHGFDTRTFTHTHAQMFIWFYFSPWCKARPQVAMLSGYKLSDLALLSPTLFRRRRDLTACLSMLPAQFLS